MKRFLNSGWRAAAVLAMGLAAGQAQAHTGHGVSGFVAGLAHPFGLDHFLAMVAVGLWSVKAWPQKHVWRGPAAFMLALLGASALATLGIELPYWEHGVAVSVVVFGGMLCWGRRAVPMSVAISAILLAGGLHGWAHGVEAPATGVGVYVLGFALTTLVLHTIGIAAGLLTIRMLSRRTDWVTPTLGAVMGGTGMYLLGQL